MASKHPTQKSRHGVRAEGKTQTSITMREVVLAQARAAAKDDGRSLSNWLERVLIEKLKLEL